MNSVRRQGYASYSPQEQCEKDQIHMFCFTMNTDKLFYGGLASIFS